MAKHKYSRRDFIGAVPCLALGTTTLFSSLINLKAMNSLMGTSAVVGGEYKALVCILLSGGNDSYNMIIPRSNNEYMEYAAARSNLAIPQNELLPITPNTTDGREYGLHPTMTGLQNLFQQGNAAFVNNVGTLVEPVTKAQIENQSANLPLGLRSHIDQVAHWQTAFPQERGSIGWGGKMADILKSMNTNDDVSMNISLGGNNVFQRGEEVSEFAINNDGGVSVFGYNNPEPFLNLMTADISSMNNKEYEDVFKDSYKNVLKRSIDSNEFFNVAIENVGDLSTQFSNTKLSQDLRMVAQSIAARNTLGAKRQIFFVEMGGYDTHDDLGNQHTDLLDRLDNALTEFYAATEEFGVSDCVTSYTISDFARTLTSNGNGTDHAWGGNTIVMGGAVKGKEMYGDYPIIGLNTNLELGGGVLLPTTSADQYFAEIALWFGISPNDLSLILPNIGNFYDTSSNVAPLGFLV
jgi:uncharacterized protein (DUF1501 family)